MLVVSILAGANLWVFMEFLWVLIIIFISFFYGVYFLFTGYQLLKSIKEMHSQDGGYTQMVRVILSIGISCLSLMLFTVLLTAPTSGINPETYLAFYFLIFFSAWTISLCVVLSFRVTVPNQVKQQSIIK